MIGHTLPLNPVAQVLVGIKRHQFTGDIKAARDPALIVGITMAPLGHIARWFAAHLGGNRHIAQRLHLASGGRAIDLRDTRARFVIGIQRRAGSGSQGDERQGKGGARGAKRYRFHSAIMPLLRGNDN